jgi:RNA polymerase sigma-70 factor (ECF subfamily)
VSDVEADLVAAVRTRDAGAFEMLIAPLIQPAYRLAYSMLRNRDEAEDAVQEAALKAWRHAGNLRAETSSLRPWFLTIVANQCRSTRRSRWWSVLRQADPAGQTSQTDEGWVQSIDLRRALTGLSADDRALLMLYYGLDMPLEQVGAVLGISGGAAKTRVYRAVGRLRPTLSGLGEPDGR